MLCPQTHPWARGWDQRVKPYIFVKVVMLHIKLKEIEHEALWKQICCHFTHQRPLGGYKRSFFLFKKWSYCISKLNWKKCRPTRKVTLWICTHLWPLGLGWRVRYWNCVDLSILLFIKLSTKTYVTAVCYDLNDTEDELQVQINGIYVLWFTCSLK